MATKVFDLYAEISLDNSSYMEGLKTSENAGKSFESTVKGNTSKAKTGFDNLSSAVSTCKTALASIGVGFAIDKVVKGLSEAYTEATKLDEKLRGASTLYGNVAVNQSALVDNLKNISLKTGESLENLGQTVYDAMSAGVQPTEDMANVLSVVETSSKLAKAGFTDTNTAMRASLSVINAYGMGIENISKVSDVLLQTQNLGVTTVGELGSSLSKVTPTASAFGVSIENVTTALAIMTKQGTSTEVASTGLSSILSELGKNGTTASENLAKASESAGLTERSFTDLLNSGKSLGDILGIMSDYAEQNNLSLVDMFSSIEAGKSALQLTNGGAEEFNATLEQMETASGLVEEGFNKMITPSEKLNTAISSLKVTIGEKLKPAIDEGKEALANLITKMIGGEGKAVDLETAIGNLRGELDKYSLAQENAKKKTDATTLSMELMAQTSAKEALRTLGESWNEYEEQYQDVGKQIEETKGKLASLEETAFAWAGTTLKLVGEDELEDIDRVNVAFKALVQHASNLPDYKEGGVNIQKKNIQELIASYSELTGTLVSLESQQKKYEDSMASNAMTLAGLVQDGKLTLDDVYIYANGIYAEVEKSLQKLAEDAKSSAEGVATATTGIAEAGANASNESVDNIKTVFAIASESILADTESSKVGIYTALKELSENYDLTVSDMTILSKAKADANKEIWKAFADSFSLDMQSAFSSTMASFEDLGEALVNGEDAWQSFGSIAIKALTQILEYLGNQLAVMAVSKALMGDWVGAGLAGAGAVLAYTTAGVTNAKGMEMLEKLGVDTEEEEKADKDKTTDKKTETTKPKTEEEVKEEKISSLEDEIAMLEALVDNKEQGVEIPEQYQQDAKIRELQDRVRELEGRLNDTKEVTVVQNINTVPMTPYELEQQAYIMAERLQWS